MKKHRIEITNGSSIAIIGAGPSGTFFADSAVQWAIKKNLNLNIVLFDGKDFTQSGPRGCNLCAGVISETLLALLKDRGILLPREKVQRIIKGYCLHGRAGSYLLTNPKQSSGITTVFRGNGPRQSSPGGNVSFDDYLLQHVRDKGLTVIPHLVKRIELPQNHENPVQVIYEVDGQEMVFQADLVVGAFGLSEKMMKMAQKLNFGYRPPRTIQARNMEIQLDRNYISERFGDNIHTYNLSTAEGMWVASIIPKKDYVTVNLIGNRDITKDDLSRLSDYLALDETIPKFWNWSKSFCTCSPRVATTGAEKPYTNRFIIIGDASCSRYYKNGIESAYVTAQLAAEAVFNWGISESALRTRYFKRIKKEIIRDNLYGRILFKINDFVAGSRFLSEVMLKVAINQSRRKKKNHMREVLWNMYTGNAPYKTIFFNFFHPALQWELIAYTSRLIIKRIVVKLFPHSHHAVGD